MERAQDSIGQRERSLRASIAANCKWSMTDPVAGTADARSASPGATSYWEQVVDPDLTLDPTERLRRAERAKKAYFQRLALKSAQARRKKAL